MKVPTYVQERIVDENGLPTDNFNVFLRNLIQEMQVALSNEGFLIPSVSSAADSVDPPQAGGQKAIVQASFQSAATPVSPTDQTVTIGSQAGTLIFDPEEVNGSVDPLVPNGQLYILLGDDTFHAIPNL